MEYLRQSTAVTKKIGPFLDDADGNTEETELIIAQADVRLSKNGGDIAQKNEATSCTHDELGIYGCPLDVTDTGTLGGLKLCVHKSGALFVWHDYTVITQNAYDALCGAEHLDVNVAEISDDSAAAGNLELALENGVAGYVASDCKKYNGQTTETSPTGNLPNINIDRINGSGTAAENLALLAVNAKGADNKALISTDAQDLNASLHVDAKAISGSTGAADNVEANIGNLDASIAGLNNISSADVTAACTAATPAVTVSDKTGFSLSTAGILAIWHQLTDAIVTASTIGKLVVDYLNASVSSRATSAKQDTMETTLDTAAGDVANIDGDAMVGTNNANTVVPDAAGVAPTAAEIKTAIEADGSKIDHLWETTEDDAGVRRFTENALEEAPTGTGSGLTAQQTRDAMKLAPTVGDPAAGSVDKHLDDAATAAALTTHDGKLDTVDGIVDNILVDTGTTIPAQITTHDGKLDTVDGIVDNILEDTNEIQGLVSDSKLPAQIKGTDNIDFSAIQKTSLNSATPAVTVSDKTGFSLSTAGILAIWHQLTAAIVTASTIGKLVVDYLNASVSSRATSAALTTHDGKLDTVDTVVDAIKTVTDNLPNSGAMSDIDTGVNNIEAKLPTNYIMGSSDQTDMDDDLAAILADTGTTLDGKLDVITNHIDTEIDAIKAKTDQLNFTGDDVKATLDSETVEVGDKTGFKLASDGLDSVSTTDPSGLASNFREMLVQLFGRFFYKLTADSSEITTHKADDNANTDQAISTVGETKTVNKAQAAS